MRVGPSRKDVDFALNHMVYAPNRLLAYSIEYHNDKDWSSEDHKSWTEIYNIDSTLLSKFSWDGDNLHEKTLFVIGDMVYAIIGPFLIPCTITSFVTIIINFEKKYRRDCKVLSPLVKIKSGTEVISSDIKRLEIYLLPYRELE